MSLYGALFSGVSGLSAQSTDLSIIADNISNVNTVGYKGGDALFQTLVTGASSSTSYSPGGVISGDEQSVTQQGLLTSTSSPTDIAIQGSGMFVVNSESSGAGQVLYTRAGSFTPDASGNLKNAAGLYLQAWPLNASGQLPGAPGNTDTTSSANLSSLTTVNVQSLAGSAEATSTVSLSANLNAGAAVYPGAGVTAAMDPESSLNYGITANDIIVPSSAGAGAAADGLAVGDQFTVATGSGLSSSYVYGGFTNSRDVTTGLDSGSGDAVMTATATLGATAATLDTNDVLTGSTTLSSTAFSTTSGSGVVTINSPANGLKTGDTVTIAGITGGSNIGGIPAADLNGTFTVTSVNGDNYQITASSGATATSTTTGGNSGVTSTIVPFSTSGTNVITVTAPDNGLTTGDTVTIAGQGSGIGGIPDTDINGTFAVTVIDANHYTITTASPPVSYATANLFSTGFGAVDGSYVISTGSTGTASSGSAIPFGDGNTATFTLTGGATSAITVDIGASETLQGLADSINANATAIADHATATVVGSGTDANIQITYEDTGNLGSGEFGNFTTSGAQGSNSGVPTGTHFTSSVASTYTTLTSATGGTADVNTTINPFTTDGTDGVVTVTDPNTTLAAGDWVTIAGVTTGVNGITPDQLNGTFEVQSVSDDGNHYTIDTSGTSDAAGGGGVGTSGIVATAAPFSVAAGTDVDTVTVYQPDNGLKTGDVVTLSGNTGDVGGIPAADLNGSFVVTVVDANHYTITTAGSNTGAATYGGAGTITATMRPFAGEILDADSPTESFLATTGTSGFTTAALSFTITTAAIGTSTFTYTPSSPNAEAGQFSNLDNLASAISDVSGLTARVVNNQLYVGATDSSAAVTFANGSTVGTAGPPVQAGIDWVGELGLSDIAASTNRYSSLQGLADLMNGSAATGVTATVNNPLATATLSINANDPLTTVTMTDKPVAAVLPTLGSSDDITTTKGSSAVTISTTANTGFAIGDIVTLNASGWTGSIPGIEPSDLTGQFTITGVGNNSFTVSALSDATSSGTVTANGIVVTPPNNTGSPLSALGITDSLDGNGLPGSPASPKVTTGALGPAYDPTDASENMASGAITPQFSRPITIYDALGTAHNLNVGFIKTGTNQWAVEVYAQPATDIIGSSLPDGLVAYGTVNFNGDGSLASVSSTLSNASISWADDAVSSSISFDWGTAGKPFGTVGASSIGKTDGLSQFDSAYAVNFANQNGAPVGSLSGVSIDQNGYIVASYSNGQTQKLYQIPIASFTAADQLEAVSGNAYTVTSSSGQESLTVAGTNDVGTISSQSLESSNVDLATQLTSMIVAQSAYQANTKVISTANTLLTDLDQILQ